MPILVKKVIGFNFMLEYQNLPPTFGPEAEGTQ